MSVYPADIDSFRTVENLPGVEYDPADTKTVFAQDANNHSDAIIAIEATLGENPQGSFDTLVDRLAPITTATILHGVGSPNGVVEAERGALYINEDLSGAWAGDILWAKIEGTDDGGWVCTSGDTGWRNITSLFSSRLTLVNPNDYGVYVRRINNILHFNIKAQTVDSTWNGQSVSLPSGFKMRSAATPAALNEALQTAGSGRGQIQISNNFIFVSASWAASGIRIAYNNMLTTTEDWPTSLPGVLVTSPGLE